MKKTTILMLSLCWLQWAGAQDTLRLTLPQALEIAMSESPTIRIADKELERVDYSKKSAWYALIPHVEGNAQYGKYVVPSKMSMMGQVMDSPTDYNAQVGMSLSLPLFAPALWQNIQMTTLEMEAAAEKASASKINLRNEVTKAYYNVLVAQDSYSVLQESYALTKTHYEVAKKGYETGALAAYDYISAEVQLNNLLPNILQAENGVEQAKTYLKILMGVNVDIPLQVANRLADFEMNIVAVNRLDNLSLEHNADLKQLEISQMQIQRSLRLQRTSRMPSLSAFGQYGYMGTGNRQTTLNFGGMPIPVEASNQWYSQGLLLGLQLRVPITELFTGSPKEKMLKIQSEEMDLQREQAKNTLHLQAVSALDKMNKTVKQVDAARKSISLSEKALAIASKRYENGAGSMVELQNALLAVTQSRLSYYQAISDYLTAKADLEKILGREAVIN